MYGERLDGSQYVRIVEHLLRQANRVALDFRMIRSQRMKHIA